MHHIAPSDWVRRFAPLIPSTSRVLDLACGNGRHTRLLASMGHRVEAVDRDAHALGELSGTPGVTTRLADLEEETWPLVNTSFAGVVVTNYLYRPHFDALLDVIERNGVLIYETFMLGNEAFGKPSNPDFLLRPHELLDRVRNGFTIVAFEQGRVALPKPACVQRICAIKGEVSPTLV